MRGGGPAFALAVAILAGGGRSLAQDAHPPQEAERPEVVARVPATPRPVLYWSEARRFEIVSLDPTTGRVAVDIADSVWRHLREPLTLPASFSPAIVVRFVPAEQWGDDAALFRTWVETGGLVSQRIRWSSELTEDVVRRALVQALLTRLAVSYHGWSGAITVPVWLENACETWVETRERPAMFDAWRQEATARSAPNLATLFDWKRADGDPRLLKTAAFALMRWLHEDGGQSQQWGAWLRGVLGGGDAATGLGAIYGQRWADEAERELAWRVAYNETRREKPVPLQTSAESREWLAGLYRIVLLDTRTGREVVLGPDAWWEHRRDREVRSVLAARLIALEGGMRMVHPFYRNAGASLGRLLVAVREERETDFAEARERFIEDAQAGRILEEETAAVLDAPE